MGEVEVAHSAAAMRVPARWSSLAATRFAKSRLRLALAVPAVAAATRAEEMSGGLERAFAAAAAAASLPAAEEKAGSGVRCPSGDDTAGSSGAGW
jgi:hypothetical protein